jgi:hypothetical protein
MAARCPVRELQPDERPHNWLPVGDETFATLGHESATEEPALARNEGNTDESLERPAHAAAGIEGSGTSLDVPQRFKVQFTASEEYVALVEEAKALLAHAVPRANLAEVQLRAIRMLVTGLKQRKDAVPARRTKATAVVKSTSDDESSRTDESSRGAVSGQTAPARFHDESPACGSTSATDGCLALPLGRDVHAQRDSDPPRQRDSHPPRPRDVDPRQRDSDPPRQCGSDPPRQRDRYVPAAVRRAVFERDGSRCAFSMGADSVVARLRAWSFITMSRSHAVDRRRSIIFRSTARRTMRLRRSKISGGRRQPRSVIRRTSLSESCRKPTLCCGFPRSRSPTTGTLRDVLGDRDIRLTRRRPFIATLG